MVMPAETPSGAIVDTVTYFVPATKVAPFDENTPAICAGFPVAVASLPLPE
jgi:hypothetical protein